MTRSQGKPPPAHVKNFLVKEAAKNPMRTNAVLSEMALEEFGETVDISTVSRYRREKGIPSSRTAYQAATSIVLASKRDTDLFLRLIEKINLPAPGMIFIGETVWSTGVGSIGSSQDPVWVRHDKGKLVDCWLTSGERHRLRDLLNIRSLQSQLAEILDHGKATVQRIASHNAGIVYGDGPIPISEAVELSKMKNPNKFTGVDRDAYELWEEYLKLAKLIENFKIGVQEHLLAIPPG